MFIAKEYIKPSKLSLIVLTIQKKILPTILQTNRLKYKYWIHNYLEKLLKNFQRLKMMKFNNATVQDL